MNIFEERINLYEKFILEKKVGNIQYYKKLIDENYNINNLLKSNSITPEIFSKFESNYKWDISKYLKNVIWCCDKCYHELPINNLNRCWWNGFEECPNCYSILTYRTGGGQGDPFNYIFKYK